MSPRGVPVSESEQAQNELLAQLGLPPSASPEDVDRLHEAASDFLASAPSELRGWAHAQVAALDAAYLHLTDPVGLEGSALRSPTRPPAVVPGGPATPPARRDPAPAAVLAAAVADDAEADEADEDDGTDENDEVAEADDASASSDPAELIDGEPDAEDLAALYASVTPSAHADMIPTAKRPTKKERRDARRVAAAAAVPAAAPATQAPNPWKRAFIGVVGLAVVVLAGFGLFSLVGGANGNAGTPAASANAGAQQTPPAVDQAKVASLMQKYAANNKDVATILALGDEFYFGNQYDQAGTWYQKAIDVDPKNETALNALGAVAYNSQDSATAEKLWLQVVGLNPNNIEAHFNLGFLYMNQTTPDLVKTKEQWDTVIRIDPTSQFAQVAQSHLNSLVKASMIPGASAGTGSPAPSAAAGASPAAPAAPAGSAPAASAGGAVVQLGAQNVQFNPTSLTAPANTPFTIQFANNDNGVQHDVVITEPGGNPVFTGALIDGGTSTAYQVGALPAGTYTFKCSIHPIMVGTLTVGS